MLNVSIATIITMNKLDKTVTRENVMSLAHQVVRGVRAVIRGETYATVFKVSIKALYVIIKESEAKAMMEANKTAARRLNALIVGYGFMYKDLLTRDTFRLAEFEALQKSQNIFKDGMFGSTPNVKLTTKQKKDIKRRLKSHCEKLLKELLTVCTDKEKEQAKANYAKTFAE
jgi:hypothetical protein